MSYKIFGFMGFLRGYDQVQLQNKIVNEQHLKISKVAIEVGIKS